MSVLQIIFGIILLLFSIAIIIVILLQEGHQKDLGTITGGADTFFPDLDADENFERAEESEEIEDNGFEIRFMRYRNKKAERL